MKTVRDVLREADPVRHEPSRDERRPGLRRAVIAAAVEAQGPARVPWARSRIAALAAAVAILAIGAATRSWWGGDAILQAAVRFEVRLAEIAFAQGLQPAQVGDTTIYLHEEAVVTNDDVASASVVPRADGSHFDVSVSFTAGGAEKMRHATAEHLGRPLAILIDGEPVMAPTVKSVIGDAALITGNFTRAQAERIANGVTLR